MPIDTCAFTGSLTNEHPLALLKQTCCVLCVLEDGVDGGSTSGSHFPISLTSLMRCMFLGFFLHKRSPPESPLLPSSHSPGGTQSLHFYDSEPLTSKALIGTLCCHLLPWLLRPHTCPRRKRSRMWTNIGLWTPIAWGPPQPYNPEQFT